MCTSMRIRTDGDYSHRKQSIEQAARFYDRNKTQAVLNSCEDVVALVGVLEDVLSREDLTVRQRREIAAAVEQRTSLDVDAGLQEPTVDA